MPTNRSVSYDRSKIVDIHFSAIKEFVHNVWERGGRNKRRVLIFLTPDKVGVVHNLTDGNTDLLARFEALDLKAYDLQGDFYAEIVGKGDDINNYFWDGVHYVNKGHSLAARLIYQRMVEEGVFGSE